MSDGDKQPTVRLRRADTARRTVEAWRLRTEVGRAWDAIAQRVGYANGPNALRAVRRWRQSLPALDIEAMRAEALARAEWLVARAMEDVEQDRPGAVTAMVRAEGRLAALVGLDAPAQVVVHSPTSAEIDAWVAGMTAVSMSELRAMEASVVYADDGHGRRTLTAPVARPGSVRGGLVEGAGQAPGHWPLPCATVCIRVNGSGPNR